MKKLKHLSAVALLLAIASAPSAFATSFHDNLEFIPSSTAPSATGTTLGQTVSSSSSPTTANAAPGVGNGITETFNISAAQTTDNGSYFQKAEITNIIVQATNKAKNINWTLTIGSVSGTDFTPLKTFTVDWTGNYAAGDYLNFALGDHDYIALDQGLYAFNISATNIANGKLFSSTTTGYNYFGGTGGTAYNLNNAGKLQNGSGAFTFYVETVPVPEPAQWALIPVFGTVAFLALSRFRRTSLV